MERLKLDLISVTVAYYKTTHHRQVTDHRQLTNDPLAGPNPPTTNHRPPTTDSPTTDHRPTDHQEPTTDLSTSVPLTQRPPTPDHQPTNKCYTDPSTNDHRLTDPITIDHGAIIRTGITCKKIPCHMRDSACRSLIVENAKNFEVMLIIF